MAKKYVDLADKRAKRPITVFRHYFHISNSGCTITLSDTGSGPQLTIESCAFGNLVQKIDLYLTRDVILTLAKAFWGAANFNFSPAYEFAAQTTGDTSGPAVTSDENEAEDVETIRGLLRDGIVMDDYQELLADGLPKKKEKKSRKREKRARRRR